MRTFSYISVGKKNKYGIRSAVTNKVQSLLLRPALLSQRKPVWGSTYCSIARPEIHGGQQCLLMTAGRYRGSVDFLLSSAHKCYVVWLPSFHSLILKHKGWVLASSTQLKSKPKSSGWREGCLYTRSNELGIPSTWELYSFPDFWKWVDHPSQATSPVSQTSAWQSMSSVSQTSSLVSGEAP